MKPAALLKAYCTIAFLLGAVLCVPVALLIKTGDLEPNAGLFLALAWNALFLLILPLVLDWSESRYANARFIAIEELAETNPELKAALDAQCEKHSLPGLRLAVADTIVDETFSYGILRQNPRLIVPEQALSSSERASLIPSIESELERFKRRDLTPLFALFALAQVGLQYLIVSITA